MSAVASCLQLMGFYGRAFPLKGLLKESVRILSGAASFPLTVNLLVCERCNLSCAMCSLKKREAPERGAGAAVSVRDIREFMDSVAGYGPLIHFGGGEPCMRPDLPELVDIVRQRRLRCVMTTNGTLLEPAAIKGITEAGIDAVIFSLYGPGPIHDSVAGVPGSFRRAMDNVKAMMRMRGRGTRVLVSTLLLPANLDAAESLVGELRELGIDAVKVEHINFLTRAEYAASSGKKGGFDLTPSALVREGHWGGEFAAKAAHVRGRLRKKFGGFVIFKPVLSREEAEAWYAGPDPVFRRCFFIRHSLFVNYNGDIIPCQFFQNCVMGNIKKDPLGAVWRSEEYASLRAHIDREKPVICSRCCKN